MTRKQKARRVHSNANLDCYGLPTPTGYLSEDQVDDIRKRPPTPKGNDRAFYPGRLLYIIYSLLAGGQFAKKTTGGSALTNDTKAKNKKGSLR